MITTLLAPRPLPAAAPPANRAARPLATDVFAYPDRYELHIEVPGAARDDLDIDVADQQLTVTLRRDLPDLGGDGRQVSAGRARGTRTARFHLGRGVDADQIDASLTDGVLTVTVATSADSRPRTVEIR